MEGARPGYSVVTITGESDAFVAPRIRAEIDGALAGSAPLVVDLSDATFLDSTVVGILLESLATCERQERPLLLLLPDDAAPEVHRLFELTGLGPLLPLVRSWDEAQLRLN